MLQVSIAATLDDLVFICDLHYPPQVHHGDNIGKVLDDGEVMSYEKEAQGKVGNGDGPIVESLANRRGKRAARLGEDGKQ